MSLEECPILSDKYCPHKTGNCKAIGKKCIYVINNNIVGEISDNQGALLSEVEILKRQTIVSKETNRKKRYPGSEFDDIL